MGIQVSPSQMAQLIPLCDMIAVDTETNGGNIRDGRGYAMGASISCRLPGMGLVCNYFPFRHTHGNNLDHSVLYELKTALENYSGWIVFHNAKFDLVSLATLGINYTGKFYDTMLMAHLRDHHKLHAFSLDECCLHYLGKKGKEKSSEFESFKSLGWVHIPSHVMTDYAIHDAASTYELGEKLLSLLTPEPWFEKVWEHKQKFVRTIIKMESRGILVDLDHCEKQSEIGEFQMDDYRELLGGLNPASGKDLQKLLVEKLGLPQVMRKRKKNGEFSETTTFDKRAMEEIYEPALEIQFPGDTTAEYILGYRGWMKAVGYYKAYRKLVSPDGRVRPDYWLHGTITGRMSCHDPNLQQIPKVSVKPWNGKIKQAFVPTPGYTLWEADYSQLEFRLGAAAGRELALIEIFNDDERDVFTEMSEKLGMLRQNTKTLVYTLNYGGGITRLVEVFGVPTTVAESIRANFFAKYPGLEHVSNRAKRVAASRGKVQLPYGRYRSFAFPSSESHKAFNAVIQGTAADLVERQMVRCMEEVDDDTECRMLLQVHDSVVWEIKNGKENDYLPRIKKVMEDVQPDFGVKFRVDIKKWGE